MQGGIVGRQADIELAFAEQFIAPRQVVVGSGASEVPVEKFVELAAVVAFVVVGSRVGVVVEGELGASAQHVEDGAYGLVNRFACSLGLEAAVVVVIVDQ